MDFWQYACSKDGDWIALVKNGKVVLQSHSIQPSDVFKLLGLNLEELGEFDLGFEGWFPTFKVDWPKLGIVNENEVKA